MSVFGTCPRCGVTTMDYLCGPCLCEENTELRARLNTVVPALERRVQELEQQLREQVQLVQEQTRQVQELTRAANGDAEPELKDLI